MLNAGADEVDHLQIRGIFLDILLGKGVSHQDIGGFHIAVILIQVFLGPLVDRVRVAAADGEVELVLQIGITVQKILNLLPGGVEYLR